MENLGHLMPMTPLAAAGVEINLTGKGVLVRAPGQQSNGPWRFPWSYQLATKSSTPSH